MSESNVAQPSPQIGVGYGAVVKFREIYVLHTEAQNVLDTLTGPLALGDLLSYSGENKVKPMLSGDSGRPAGLAAYEAVADSTGVFGYKPASGDPIGVYKKGRFYMVNVKGTVAKDKQLVPHVSVPGAVRERVTTTDDALPTIGICRVGNNSVADAPIEAEVDFTVSQSVL